MKSRHAVLTLCALAFPLIAFSQPADAARAYVHGGHGHSFVYRGRHHDVVRLHSFVWPRGYRYRAWGAGDLLPAIFLTDAYYYADYVALGLEPPPPGFRWVRYGPDLLLVNVRTGRIAEVVNGAVEEY